MTRRALISILLAFVVGLALGRCDTVTGPGAEQDTTATESPSPSHGRQSSRNF